jgi:serine protease Do
MGSAHKVAAFIVLTVTGLVSASDAADHRDLRRTPIVRVVEQVRDSIVNISATRRVYAQGAMDIWDLFFEARPVPRNVSSVGSGFVMHEAGYIVTNAHVVARSMDLWVTFASGQE